MKTLISIEEILKKSWKACIEEWRASLKFILPAILIPILGGIIFALSAEYEMYLAPAVAVYIAGIIASIYFSLALTKYFINLIFEKKASPWPDAREYFGTMAIGILYSLIVIIGLILFIIPGIWLAMVFAFSLPIYLNEKTTVIGAMKRSKELVQRQWWAALIRLLLPNLLWQIGVSFVVFGSMLLFATFGAIWFGLIASIERTGGVDLMQILTILGGILGIIAILGAVVLQLAAYLAAGIAQISILLETYKSLDKVTSK